MGAQTIYYAAMSLDGFNAEPEERLDWLTGFEPAEWNAGYRQGWADELEKP